MTCKIIQTIKQYNNLKDCVLKKTSFINYIDNQNLIQIKQYNNQMDCVLQEFYNNKKTNNKTTWVGYSKSLMTSMLISIKKSTSPY